MRRRQIAAGPDPEIVLLAMEIDALDAAGALDASTDDEVLGVVERHGGADASAGLLLTLFARRGPPCAGLLWRRMSAPSREALIGPMFRIQPQVSARSLGAANLRDSLAVIADPRLHDAIAGALATTFVTGSEICLDVLLPPARDRLAPVLAERAGRDTDTVPDWVARLPDHARGRATMAFAFGALLAKREASFSALTASFTAQDWDTMLTRARERGAEMPSGSVELLLRSARPSAGSRDASFSHRDPATQRRRAAPSRGALGEDPRALTDCEQACAIVAATLAADAEALSGLAASAGRINAPTWRREAQTAVFRRALAIGARGVPAGLPRADVGSAIVLHRLARGDTSVLRRRAWGAIRADRRFTLLLEVVARLEDGSVAPTEVRLQDVATAVLAMTDATREVLTLHFLTQLGRLAAMTDVILDRIAAAPGRWKDEIFIALARIHALRGNAAKAQIEMSAAQSTSEDRMRETAFERLNGLLGDAGSVPAEPLDAIVSALATVSAPDLPAAMRLCFARMPRPDIDFVVADVISRGRAADAFPELAA